MLLGREALKPKSIPPWGLPHWFVAETGAGATDLAEYLGTITALHYLFGVPLPYASISGALDVIIIMTLMTRRFRVIEQIFMLLITSF